MQKIHVMPRDIQDGDLIAIVSDDLTLVDVAVDRVEKIRSGNHTAYKVHLDPNQLPHIQPGWMILQPSSRVSVKRAEA